MSDAAEQLRIIAADGGALSQSDRDLLACVADEIDRVERDIARYQLALIESQQQNTAMHERLMETARPAALDLSILDRLQVKYAPGIVC